MRRADREERRLLAAVRAGSTADLERLFRLHWPRAHRAALLVVHDTAAAEDIAQEAFVSALRFLVHYDPRATDDQVVLPIGTDLSRLRTSPWIPTGAP